MYVSLDELVPSKQYAPAIDELKQFVKEAQSTTGFMAEQSSSNNSSESVIKMNNSQSSNNSVEHQNTQNTQVDLDDEDLTKIKPNYTKSKDGFQVVKRKMKKSFIYFVILIFRIFIQS